MFVTEAPCAALLKICRMDKVGGSCTGNEEVFLLCDKVQRGHLCKNIYSYSLIQHCFSKICVHFIVVHCFIN